MHTTTSAETISNCVKFGASLKEEIGFAVAVSEGQAIRAEIESGKYEGVSFPDKPDPTKPVKRASRRLQTQEQRVSMVSAVHSLRRDGRSAVDASKAVGIPYQTYASWAVEEKMPYEGKCLRGPGKR